MQISRGVKKTAQKVVIYGVEGIGKSTFASKFPNPLFIDTEDSTTHLDVARFDKPLSWQALIDQIQHVKNNPGLCSTLVIDTADWAETLCKDYLCHKNRWTSISQPGYGAGYVELANEYGQMLNALTGLIGLGINVVILAHAQAVKFELPELVGTYDKWQLKLEKKTGALIKEWADAILFLNYRVFITGKDNSGKGKATGGERTMYTEHRPAFEAKNRWGLVGEHPLDYQVIAPFIYDTKQPSQEAPQATVEPVQLEPVQTQAQPPEQATQQDSDLQDVPSELQQLMEKDNITLEQLQRAVTAKGIYPEGTPFKNYSPDFVKGAIIAQWDAFAQFAAKQ